MAMKVKEGEQMSDDSAQELERRLMAERTVAANLAVKAIRDLRGQLATVTADRESWIADRDSWLARYEAVKKELAAMTAERDAAVRQADELEKWLAAGCPAGLTTETRRHGGKR